MDPIAVVSATNTDGYAVELRSGRHTLVADEPRSAGGADSGASPYGLVLAGLAACTAITLRMYAERKHWPLGEVRVRLTMTEQQAGQHIDRVISLAGPLDDAQRSRLLDISERTPVTRTLRPGATIATRLAEPAE